jgi:hypothetical protein
MAYAIGLPFQIHGHTKDHATVLRQLRDVDDLGIHGRLRFRRYDLR